MQATPQSGGAAPMRIESVAVPRIPHEYAGRLENDDAVFPVALSEGSPLSLRVRFASAPPPSQTEFRRLWVELPDGEVEFSRCRLSLDPADPQSERLVFLDDCFDCHRLFTEGKRINVRQYFHNVPLVLRQKDGVRQSFREYTADLLFDLSAYKKFFNDQDRMLQHEPPDVVRAAQDSLLAHEGRAFFAFFDERLQRLGRVVTGFSRQEHEQHGFYLRKLAWDYIVGSEFLKRTNLKPRGYAGDAEMMLMAYRNEPVGKFVFHKLMHQHPLQTPAAEAVRYRPKLIARELEQLRQALPGPIRFLSLASGPAWELKEIYKRPEDFESLRCVLFDRDTDALAHARSLVDGLEAAHGRRMQLDLVDASVRTMLRRDVKSRLGRFHFIYSMGLFDYLSTPVAKAVLARMFELLEPSGKLIVGNFHVDNPSRTYMAYWMDWDLCYRTEQEMLDLGDLPGASRSLSWDPQRAQMFLTLRREGEP